MDNLSIQDALIYGRHRLEPIEAENAGRSAEILLQHTLQATRTYLYTYSYYLLSDAQYHHYQSLLAQREHGTPVAYLIGHRSFWSFDLHVTDATLIPRAETEILVERTLALTDPHRPYTVLDLGTGSGAIALALATERPHWQITACDYSLKALDIAKSNAATLQLSHINFIQSDWLKAFHSNQFDIIVANPPYIAEDDPHLDQGDLRFEPRSALVSTDHGLGDLHTIICHASTHLKEQGILLVEHGYQQGMAVRDLFHHYQYQMVKTWQDMSNHDRVCSGKKM